MARVWFEVLGIVFILVLFGTVTGLAEQKNKQREIAWELNHEKCTAIISAEGRTLEIRKWKLTGDLQKFQKIDFVNNKNFCPAASALPTLADVLKKPKKM
jgi:hypothetical protein